MVGQTISHYKILEKLGEGGMGEVYLAEDTDLNRKVALKFLPQQLTADPETKLRFKQEAQAAAALNHPNIITVYEVAEYQRAGYIAMEYVAGQSLRDLAAGRGLPAGKALDIAIQIAEGLEKAHQAGIVHRDIKSDNILINQDGRVKILDFGLAKLKGASRLIQPGSTAGTVAYMSPEQATGEEVDQRSDLFSLGVVFYELLTGQLPFPGEHQTAILYSILNEPPQPLARFAGEVPAQLQEIVEKMLAKKREERFQSAAELVVDLRRCKKELEEGKPEAPKKEKKAVAVLYFENLSAEPDSDYFSAGITEDIITDLSKIESLRVASRNAVLPYKDQPVDIPLLGRKLNLDAVLEGSVRKFGNRLRITAQLIDTKEGFHLWAERYDREMQDVFVLQEEIAKKIALALQVTLSEKDEEQIAMKYKGDLDAYSCYLKGRGYYYKYTKPDLLTAMQMFNSALELDPQYALAHAGLSDCYAQMIDKYSETDQTFFAKAEEAGLKALRIDSRCAEAYKALGVIYSKQGHNRKSKEQFLQALAIKPNYAPARASLGVVYTNLGNFAEAEKEYLLAYEQDPSMTVLLYLLANFHLSVNNFSRAENYIDQLLEAGESSFYLKMGHYVKARISFYQRQYESALAQMQKYVEMEPAEPIGNSGLAMIYAALGDHEKAREKLDGALKTFAWHEYVIENTILTYTLLGEKGKVYEWMTKGMEANKIDWLFLEFNPLLEELRHEPEFQHHLQEIKKRVLNSE